MGEQVDTYKWRFKGPRRDEWFVAAKRFGDPEDAEPDADGLVETYWDVTVETATCQSEYRVSFRMVTLRDDLSPIDVWRELNDHFAQLTIAVIDYHGQGSDGELFPAVADLDPAESPTQGK